MKAIGHPFEARSKLGLYYEHILKPALEMSVGETITKTTDCHDMMDFQGKTVFVELKTRGDQYHFSQDFIQKKGWILPFCKIERARQEVAKGKQVVFFYFWLAGKSLWRWDFSEEGILDSKEEYPSWHQDGQKQIFIHERNWKRVN